jgi:putative DNA methylase
LGAIGLRSGRLAGGLCSLSVRTHDGAALARQTTMTLNRPRLRHINLEGVPQHVVFRLHDSLPQSVLDRWDNELKHLSNKERESERGTRIAAALDQGIGCCLLKDEACAQRVVDALFHHNGERYQLLAWVIMPNHVHVLLTVFAAFDLAQIVHSWKSYTAKELNRLTNARGRVWQRNYFDRLIRDDEHYAQTVEYIHMNPVVAGLVAQADQYRFSSAFDAGGARLVK